MKVITLAVLVALLTAAVAVRMKKHKGNCREAHSCIATITELEKSLFQRKSNIDRLHRAFFPSDQHFPVAVDLVVHFSTSLQNASQGLANTSTIMRRDNAKFEYKFRWSESTVLLFIQPEMLRPLSLFVYQGVVTTAEIVIDPICDTETQQMRMYKGIRRSTDDGKAKQLLNSLCVHLQSYVLNRAAKMNKELTGYCLYYFSNTELHILDNSTEDVMQRIFLVVAIFFLCLVIAICVPVALYSEVLFKVDEENSTRSDPEENSTGSDPEENSTRSDSKPNELDASMVVVKIAKVMLIKTKESSYMYYIASIFTIAPFLDIGILGLNIWLLVQCKLTWYIACFISALIVLLAFNVICIAVLTYNRWDGLKSNMSDNCCFVILYGLGIASLVVALQLLTFHGTFILLAFTSSPLLTTSFTFIYISVLFGLLGFVSIWIKVFHKKCCKEDTSNKNCYYLLQVVAVTLSFVCVLSFDALFLVTLMRARVHYNPLGIVALFGAIVPPAVLALLTFLGNKMISMVSTTEEKTRDSYEEIKP